MPIEFQPRFIQTRNVRNFEVLMDGIQLAAGEGRLGMVCGQAGRGKTRTVQWYAANNDCVYLRMLKVWRQSELQFLQELERELGHQGNPHYRKGPAFAECVDRLIDNPKPIFLDEIEKLQPFFLEVIRDLSDLSTAPVILVGEAELRALMQRNRRVWSRTYQQLEFKPTEVKDVLVYFKDSTGIALDMDRAKYLQAATGKNFRKLKSTIINLVQIFFARGSEEITDEIIDIAVKTGLEG